MATPGGQAGASQGREGPSLLRDCDCQAEMLSGGVGAQVASWGQSSCFAVRWEHVSAQIKNLRLQVQGEAFSCLLPPLSYYVQGCSLTFPTGVQMTGSLLVDSIAQANGRTRFLADF